MRKYGKAGNVLFWAAVDEAPAADADMVTICWDLEKDDYEDFLEKLIDDVKALGYTDEDLKYGCQEDGTQVLEIRVHNEAGDRMIAMQIYPKDLFKASQEHGYDAIMGDLRDRIRETGKSFESIDLSGIPLDMDYESVKEELIVRPLNFTRYARKLKNGIYEKHGDIALVLYRVLLDTDHNLLTHMVLKEELQAWGQQEKEEEILHDALIRTAEKYPACILSRTSDSVNLLSGHYEREDVITPRGAVMLSTERGINGAAAMFYPGVAQKMAELMHGKYAAVFMNTTDVMIVKPDSPYLNGYMEYAGHDNEYGEMLSGRKYLFNQEGRLINA